MANENMRLSQAGWAALRQRENAIMAYYNDQANNCTYGVGRCCFTPDHARRKSWRAPCRPHRSMRNWRLESALRRRPCGARYRIET